tara:strand:+ start:559 stop:762 length:204 start_codon:yes stop_codon:yes gene_type:complete
MIRVIVNGQDLEIHRSMTIGDYCNKLGVDTGSIAIAHNGVVIRKDELPLIPIADGDRIEIVRAVGGG